MKNFVSLIVSFSFCLFSSAQAQIYSHKFTELQIKDYEQMNAMVEEKISESKALAIKFQQEGADEQGDKAAVTKLKEALILILSRPNKDNMVTKLMPNLRTELNNYGAFQSSLEDLARQAIRAIQNDSLPVIQRSTAVFVLENLLSEIKPLIGKSEDFRDIVRLIRDAALKIPPEVISNRKLTSMDATPDLSKIADILLKNSEAKPKTQSTDSD